MDIDGDITHAADDKVGIAGRQRQQRASNAQRYLSFATYATGCRQPDVDCYAMPSCHYATPGHYATLTPLLLRHRR